MVIEEHSQTQLADHGLSPNPEKGHLGPDNIAFCYIKVNTLFLDSFLKRYRAQRLVFLARFLSKQSPTLLVPCLIQSRGYMQKQETASYPITLIQISSAEPFGKQAERNSTI